MNNFYLAETEFTPEISFNIEKRKLTFKGVSRPEDVVKFYQPAVNWLREFDEDVLAHSSAKFNMPSIHVEFELTYFNSASSKMLLQLLEIIKKFQDKGIDIVIDWYYDANDEAMYDDGADLSDAVNLPFNFHTI